VSPQAQNAASDSEAGFAFSSKLSKSPARSWLKIKTAALLSVNRDRYELLHEDAGIRSETEECSAADWPDAVIMPIPKTPLLAVDCVVFDGDGRLLLIRRGNPPFAGELALPGGFVEVGEAVEDACRRELLEETGIRVGRLHLIGVYSAPDRDPRGHTCSVAFRAQVKSGKGSAGSDASAVEWSKSWRRARLAFDHRRIISDAARQLKDETRR
jgi:8-oxo-dGTP diphosphatase